MKQTNEKTESPRKPFTKPSSKMIDMSPCAIVSLSNNVSDPPAQPTGGGLPDAYVPSMGWGD